MTLAEQVGSTGGSVLARRRIRSAAVHLDGGFAYLEGVLMSRDPEAGVVSHVSTEWLQALYLTDYGRCVRLAALLGAGDPEDVAQEAFLQVFRHLDGLRDRSAAPSYMSRTVVNLVRRRGERSNRLLRGDAKLVTALRRPASTQSAEAQVIGRSADPLIAAALQKLSQPQREVITLRYWADLSVADTAGILCIPEGTVKSHAVRALRQIRDEINEGAEHE